jgi:2-oxoglutarate ferredoxin oxidoreductase subunit gamma
MSKVEIRLAGFGGQGIILLGNIIGKAASIYDHQYAALTQSYGPESRGGSCRAELIISDSPVEYPYLVAPEIVVTLSQESYSEFGAKAREGTLLIVDSSLVRIEEDPSARIFSIPASLMAQEMGRPVVANIIVLGFLAAHSTAVSREALEQAVKDFIPKGSEEFNMKAFELGYSFVQPDAGAA